MTIIRAKLPMDATGPINEFVLSRIGTPHAAYVSLVAFSMSTTVQLPALQPAAVAMNCSSAQRQATSLGEQLVVGKTADKH
jgi:hypothetical protein